MQARVSRGPDGGVRPDRLRVLATFRREAAAGPAATGVILTVTAVGMQKSGWLVVWGGSATRPTASTLNVTPGTPVPITAVVTLGSSRSLWVLNGSAGTTHVLLAVQGYLVAHSPATARPGTTTFTYSVGADRAGLSVVPLSSTGSVRLWNMSSAPVHVVVDSFGWVAGGDPASTPAGLAVGAPTRILDTRTASGGGAVGAGAPRRVPLTAGQGSAVLLSVTVTGATGSGHLRFLARSGSGWQFSPSFLNFAAGRTVTTSVLLPVPAKDTLEVVLDAVTSGSVHMVVDRIAAVGQRAEVTGTVRDKDTGAGVDEALVSTDTDRSTRATSLGDGSYRAAPANLKSVAVCASTGSEASGAFVPDGRYRTGCARSADGAPLQVVALPLGGRLVGEDVALTPSGVLTGKVVGPSGKPDVFGQVSVAAVDGSTPPTFTGFGTTTGRADGTAGATTFTVPPTGAVTVPALTLQDPGNIDPTIVDPDGDLSDVSIDYVHSESGYRVWGYPVGSPVSSLGASIPLRPGGYAVCVTEGPTTVCNDGSSSAARATPVQVVAGRTVGVTLTLP